MAYDKDVKIKVRAFYECNNVSMAKAAEHFESLGYEVKLKTMQSWASEEKWQKNKYESLRQSVSSLVPVEVLDSVGDKVKASIIDAMVDTIDGITPSEIDDDEVEAVSEELIWGQLNKKALMGELAENLHKTKKIVKNSTSISVKATYHAMVINTIQTVHGKKVQMVPQDPNHKMQSEEELENMNTEALLEILER